MRRPLSVPLKRAAADDHVAEAVARGTADRDAVAVQAGEVFDQHVVRAALQRDVVVAGIDLAFADDDALAAGIHGIGVGRVAGRDDAEVFDGDVLRRAEPGETSASWSA